MDLPNENTIKIIEERKKYLLERTEKQNNRNGFILSEIKALDRISNLINLVKNNFPDDSIKKMIGENLQESNVAEQADDDNGYRTLYSYDQDITENSKLEISFIEYENNLKRYIVLIFKKYKKNLFKWIYQGKIKLTSSILEEILKKSHEMEIK
ncbi:MAG: hypothetical protein LBH20_11640 [Treponema sp.]|jgi:hypothetical protein|nr:hypothetical protein [Treponema sp.]